MAMKRRGADKKVLELAEASLRVMASDLAEVVDWSDGNSGMVRVWRDASGRMCVAGNVYASGGRKQLVAPVALVEFRCPLDELEGDS